MFERSEKTEKMCRLFRTTNGTLTYERIEKEFGEGLDALRQTILNVRRYLERDEGIVFATVRGVGYKRLSDSEKVESASSFQRKIRRTAVRGVMRIDAVHDFAGLSNEDQLLATVRKTVFEAVQREAAEK